MKHTKEYFAAINEKLKLPNPMEGKTYYRLKDPAKLGFEMTGMNVFDKINFKSESWCYGGLALGCELQASKHSHTDCQLAEFQTIMHSLDVWLTKKQYFDIYHRGDPELSGDFDIL